MEKDLIRCSRRSLLATGGAVFAAAQLPRLASAAGASDPRLVVIILRGALDGLSAVAPIGDPDYAGLHGTLCLSTQVGCAYGCKFCASGLEGWKRNLTAGEIVAQILETERATKTRVNNLVFMGMGEPLANYANLMKALEIINSPWGVGIGARHITISTSGLAPQIRELADQPLQIRLALSLHGATDDVRRQIMPVNRKYPLAELLDACAEYQAKKRKMMTLEYILIEGVNDSTAQAAMLAKHARRLHAKVNLIPYNTVEGLDWRRPTDAVIDRFADVLHAAKISATVRREKGHDIDAACGQLRLKHLKADSSDVAAAAG